MASSEDSSRKRKRQQPPRLHRPGVPRPIRTSGGLDDTWGLFSFRDVLSAVLSILTETISLVEHAAAAESDEAPVEAEKRFLSSLETMAKEVKTHLNQCGRKQRRSLVFFHLCKMFRDEAKERLHPSGQEVLGLLRQHNKLEPAYVEQEWKKIVPRIQPWEPLESDIWQTLHSLFTRLKTEQKLDQLMIKAQADLPFSYTADELLQILQLVQLELRENPEAKLTDEPGSSEEE